MLLGSPRWQSLFWVKTLLVIVHSFVLFEWASTFSSFGLCLFFEKGFVSRVFKLNELVKAID